MDKGKRTPMAEREYPSVEKPILTTGRFGLLPAKVPCAECPLARTAEPGALGGYTVMQYIEVLMGPADLACHMSKGFPDDRAEQRSCTGVAMFRANCEIKPKGLNALEAVESIGPNRELVFDSLLGFYRHHTKGSR